MTARNFARYDSLLIFLARSGKNSHSLSFAPFLARCRSLSLSLRGLHRPTHTHTHTHARARAKSNESEFYLHGSQNALGLS